MTRHIILVLLFSFGIVYAVSAQDQNKINRYNLLVEEYFSYYEQNKMDSAELVLRQALDLLPSAESNVLLQGNLAELVLARRDTMEAISLLSRALGQQPEVTKIRERRGQILTEMKRYNEALADFDYIVKAHPNQEVPRYRRALLYIGMDLLEAAQKDLEIIIAHNDAAYIPRMTLADVHHKQGDERTAEQLLSFLIEKYPDTPQAYRARAKFYISQDRKAEALKDIRTVIQKGKGLTAEDYRIRGDIWLMYGETTLAKKDYDKAKSLEILSEKEK